MGLINRILGGLCFLPLLHFFVFPRLGVSEEQILVSNQMRGDDGELNDCMDLL
jgi:hypothetical protein